jgi:DNA-binding GntR family transcriptional regulator
MKKKMTALELAYQHLLEQITVGKLSPFEKLDERTISGTLKLSRTPVREALRKLEANGYVTISPRKGCFVRRHSPREIDDMYRIMAKLEGLAVELAAPKIGETELEELETIAQKITLAYQNNAFGDEWRENQRFHFLLAHLSGNAALEDLIQQSRKKINLYRYFELIAQRANEYIHDHWDIIEALREKDYSVAAQRMESHVNLVRKVMSDFYEKASMV